MENMVRDQANMLVAAGHQVRVVTGLGGDPKEGYEVVVVPEMAPDFPHNKAVRAVLDKGQMDQTFNFLPVEVDRCAGCGDGGFRPDHRAQYFHGALQSAADAGDARSRRAIQDDRVDARHDGDQSRLRAAEPDPAAVEFDAHAVEGGHLRGDVGPARGGAEDPPEVSGDAADRPEHGRPRRGCSAVRRMCARRCWRWKSRGAISFS